MNNNLLRLSQITFNDLGAEVLDQGGQVLTQASFFNLIQTVESAVLDAPPKILLAAFRSLTSTEICARLDLFDDDGRIFPLAQKLCNHLDEGTLTLFDATQLVNNFIGMQEKNERYAILFDILENKKTLWDEKHFYYFSELLHEYLHCQMDNGKPDFETGVRFFKALMEKLKEKNLDYLLKNQIKKEAQETFAVLLRDGAPHLDNFLNDVSGYGVVRFATENMSKNDVNKIIHSLSSDMLSTWFPAPDKRFIKLVEKTGDKLPNLRAHLSKMQLEKDMGEPSKNKAKPARKI